MEQTSSERPLPKTLFKYRPLSADNFRNVASIVQQDELYFSAATAFNDPFDSAPHINIKADPKVKRRYVESRAVAHGYTPYEAKLMSSGLLNLADAELEEFGRNALKDALGRMGVCSLAARHDHVLMWSHYASNHSGVCLAFDVTRGGFSPYGPFQVTYQDDRPTYNVFNDSDAGPFQRMLIKAKFWAYEEEWRLVATDDAGPGVKPIGPASLSAIYLGCAITEDHRRQLIALAMGRSRPTPVFQMTPSARTFELGCAQIA